MDLLLTITGHDMDLRANDLQLVSGRACTAQIVKIRWLTLVGEWFLEGDDFGMWRVPGDFRDRASPARLAQLRSRLVREATDTPGVIGCVIHSLVVDRATRRLAIKSTVTLDNGDAIDVTFDERVA